MNQYEYKFLEVPNPKGREEIINILNEAGKEGWKLITSFIFSDYGKLLLEREKEKED